jgi:hypothetical protein
MTTQANWSRKAIEALEGADLRAYTAEQVAAMYQTPVSTIKELARRRLIPCLLVGGKYRFLDRHLTGIDEYFEQRTERSRATGTPRRRTTKPSDSAVTTLRARSPKRRSA